MRLVALTAAAILSVSTLGIMAPQTAQAAEKNDKESTKVEVKPGDSLSKIAKANKTTYQRLFYKNTDIKHPDVIYPGDDIVIPEKDEKLKKRELPSETVAAPAQPAAPQAVAPQPVRQSNSAPTHSTPAVNGGVWDQIAQCESGGNWSINTGNGYYGGLQFSLQSWQAVGGSGLPSDASKAEQIARAEQLRALQGFGAWPACSAKLGLL